MRIAYLVPFPGVPGGFWDVVVALTQAAAARLGVDLEIIDCGRSAERMIELGRARARRAPAPDCVLLPNYLGAGPALLPELDRAGVAAFLVTEGLSPSDRFTHGEPRVRHGRFLGELSPDDVAAGHLLAKRLTDAARTQGLVARDGKVHVGVLSGDQTSAGQSRFKGWLNLRKEQPDVVQAGVQCAGWDEESGRESADLLLRAHPEITVLWAANDSMALGAIEALRAGGRKPGVDVLVGGMDLLPRALARVEDGAMALTLGGHVLDGARALLLVHDHLKGEDFAPTIRRSVLEPVTAPLAPAYLRFFEQQAWRRVEFERFSRARHPGAEIPALTLASLVEGAKGA